MISARSLAARHQRGRTVRPGESIAAAGSILLALCLYLPWYERAGETVSGSNVSWLLTVAVFVAIAIGPLLLCVCLFSTHPAAGLLTAIFAIWIALIAVGVIVAVVIYRYTEGADLRFGCIGGILSAALSLFGLFTSVRDERPGREAHIPEPLAMIVGENSSASDPA